MGVPTIVWALTIVMVAALMLFDYVFHVRHTHVPTLREAALWSAIYVGVAIMFGVGVVIFGSIGMGIEYFAGYLSNEALSVDNLFVFLVVISSFGVPRVAQQKVLLFGVAFALIARTGFILLGGALIEHFNAAFYVFGLTLLIMAGNLAKPAAAESRDADNLAIRLANRFLRTSQNYNGDRFFIVENESRVMTPLLLVMLAVGGSDLLFAFDSVPALFGLTQNVYLVFAATAFSLLGLRQLYFLIDNLLYRLIYLPYGLATILGFIGIKLMLEALHHNTIAFINRGRPVTTVEMSTAMSLTVIVVVLLLTTVASLVSVRGRRENAAARARRHALEYLDLHHPADPVEREEIFAALLQAEDEISSLPLKHRAQVQQDTELTTLLQQAHNAREARE
ncbi:Inner membrane protein alx [Mycobacterium marinum]|uniref:TerC/Alx family metal homeostasis membrane protein n=2 Tax=Mycobacterium marinum TaxID=1781 RepID=UPI000358A2C0|nr:TerC/Alx family metal homeostasis membrane protein [Mycobacterium marinum]AXN43944.1 Inner membrane protein alx [Mycobacterium marinum]AXN49314.1 Inner membrane protein alx [Mycobacterium marinum]EPQ79616.1 Integral membrane protein TerC [Mycobacterium marinum str. Europe]RFZ03393.1 Inner membrane protein alx [Mycobacterium marinum]RFZ16908.1 Inner membrane protein alx [Mycobacterium marinum]